MGVGVRWDEGEVRVGDVRIVQNVHIYENRHNWGRKLVPRHDSGGIPKGFIDLI